METPSYEFQPVYKLSDEPSFHFGPYVPIRRQGDNIIFDGNSLVDDYKEQDNLRRFLNFQAMPDDCIVEAPSLVTPYLLKKRTKWPAPVDNVDPEVWLTPERRSPPKLGYDRSIQRGPLSRDVVGFIQPIKVCKSGPTLKKRNPNLRTVEDYAKSAAIADISKSVKPEHEPLVTTFHDYYKTSAGQMLLGIGISQVIEFNLNENIKRLKSKLKKDAQNSELQGDLDTQTNELRQVASSNRPYQPKKMLKCKFCDFQTGLTTVLGGHLEYPHTDQRNTHFCNWCEFKTKQPAEILFHTTEVHKRLCRLEPPFLKYQCELCSFEANTKRKFNVHLGKCEATFPVAEFLSPEHFGGTDYPSITPKLITGDDIQAYESALASFKRSSRTYPLKFNYAIIQNSPITVMRTNIGQRSNEVTTSASNNLTANQQPVTKRVYNNSDGLVSFPPPRHTETSQPVQKPQNSKTATFVICEMCDCYIINLKELRHHMQSIHKTKLSHRTLESKPPLGCQKCQWRFFTDQGLERHLLGSHGLVTSTMQEKIDEGTDSGRCTICGQAFTSKLVSHLRDDHKINLKNAHLSYKCTACRATFSLYRLFENHVYNVHQDKFKSPESEQPMTNGHDAQPSRASSADSAQAGPITAHTNASDTSISTAAQPTPAQNIVNRAHFPDDDDDIIYID